MAHHNWPWRSDPSPIPAYLTIFRLYASKSKSAARVSAMAGANKPQSVMAESDADLVIAVRIVASSPPPKVADSSVRYLLF